MEENTKLLIVEDLSEEDTKSVFKIFDPVEKSVSSLYFESFEQMCASEVYMFSNSSFVLNCGEPLTLVGLQADESSQSNVKLKWKHNDFSKIVKVGTLLAGIRDSKVFLIDSHTGVIGKALFSFQFPNAVTLKQGDDQW